MKNLIFILLFIPLLVFSQEKISNGTFDNNSKWTLDSEWTIGSGVASFDDSGAGYLKQVPDSMASTIANSTGYILRFKITTANPDDYAYLRIYGTGATPTYKALSNYYNGWCKVFFTTPASGNGGGIEFYASTTGDAFDIDSISLKQLTTATNDPYYVATDGDDTNDGSFASPWASLGRAVHTAVAGDTIYFRGGVYYKEENEYWGLHPTSGYGTNGVRGNHIYYMGYPDDVTSSDSTMFVSNGDTTHRLGNLPVFDCRYQHVPQPDTTGIEADPATANPIAVAGIVCSADFITFKDLVIRNIYQKRRYIQATGFDMTNSFNLRVERCVLYNSSGHGFYYDPLWAGDGKDSTIFLNNDAFSCVDSFSINTYNYIRATNAPQAGTWGNGFMLNVPDIPGNDTLSYIRFIGNRGWHNADEGTNHSATGTVYDSLNWMFANGYYLLHGVYDNETSGNGWKLNSGYTEGMSDSNRVQNYFYNNIAALNIGYGYGQNNNGQPSGNREVYNNTSYRNQYGFQVLNTGDTDSLGLNNNKYVNNISYSNRETDLTYKATDYMHESTTNSWDGGVTVTDADFVLVDSTTAVAQMKAPRKADGSLPDITFMSIAIGSDLIDAGTDVGLPYNSTAPDLGFVEYNTGSQTPPVANFSASSTTILQRQSVFFSDLSTNTTSWSWTFDGGNPSTSTAQNPTVYYYTPGTYSVTLTATNADGSDSETKVNYITVTKKYKILIK